MWLSILTHAIRPSEDVMLRVFGIEFTADSIASKHLTQYQLGGLYKPTTYDELIKPFVGHPFECDVEIGEAVSTLWVSPDYQDEQAITCSTVVVQSVEPTDTDWACMALVGLKLYAETYERSERNSSVYDTFIDELGSEIAQQIVRHERKFEFFQNAEKKAEIAGRLHILRRFRERLEKPPRSWLM